jgi:hypothetical protein
MEGCDVITPGSRVERVAKWAGKILKQETAFLHSTYFKLLK